MSEDEAAEDDWFEQALEEGAARDRSTGDDVQDADAAPDADVTPDADADLDADAPSTAADESSETDDHSEASESSDASERTAPEGGGFDDVDPDSDELDAAFEAATEATSDADTADPFADGATGDAFGDDTDDFGLGASGTPRAGQGVSGQGGDLFEDDFASAFGGGSESETFDDEDFESEIPRIDVGIEGLDRMIRGGVPQRHLMVAIGSAGTGKTTFGLQYLNHGLENGEKAVFITLEQTHDSIIDTAAEYGWDFEAYEASGDLAVIDLDPIEMANSLDNIRAELPTLVEDFGADRFVLDSVSLLEMMYDEQARRRTEVFDFTRSLKRAGVTTLLTSEADEDNSYASRHGIIEYLTDAVFVLQYVRAETQETRLAVEIQKIRNANHSRETKPYEITDAGISVYEQANIF